MTNPLRCGIVNSSVSECYKAGIRLVYHPATRSFSFTSVFRWIREEVKDILTVIDLKIQLGHINPII